MVSPQQNEIMVDQDDVSNVNLETIINIDCSKLKLKPTEQFDGRILVDETIKCKNIKTGL